MDFERIKRAIKDCPEYQVTREDKSRIYFHRESKRFAVCENGTYFNIYHLTACGVFLPGPKSGDSIQAIESFVGKTFSSCQDG
ncbi:hypothetical protein SG34_013360 [Thalassomonas viridans]|uniref:Uncharacterized protein n=1 Tax=Thalassomonas viridans TaxID=137584 RepID=A0AAE9Z6N8_9GAMM|nr:hypothetical protein [Thalassomonas viridans]WDE07776.1 hypothetical protein SG34_013360 [Thalassomonas viridans]